MPARRLQRFASSVDHRPMNLISRVFIGVGIVFLTLASGTTARPVVGHAGLRDRAPAKPSGLTVVSRTNSSLRISWRASAPGVSYGVYLGTKRVASTTATTYTLTRLKCATSYRIGVDAVRAANKRSARAWVSATRLACPSPPPPSSSSVGCFAAPGACGYPDPAYGNVGVPAGTTLRPSGSITVSADGTVIDGLDVAGTIEVKARNVTIKNTRVTPTGSGCGPANTCGNYAILVTCACSVTISHVELTANAPTTVEHAIRNASGGTINVDHVYQHGNIDALCICGNGSISDSYSIIHLAISTDHLENIYLDDASLSIVHNTLLNQAPQTANIFGNTNNGSDGPCENHLTIDGNLLAGGGWNIYPCAHATSVGSSSSQITNNRFARCKTPQSQRGGGTWLCTGGPDSSGYYPNGGSFGYLASAYCKTSAAHTWSGNVWDDNNATVNCR